jgi:outer membrane protein OmpA-like peptidoglycan-associated protein
MTRPLLEEEEQPAKVPGWAYTYIDLLWLLLLFFILRSAVSEVSDGPLYHNMAAALKHRFGVEAKATVAAGNRKNLETAASGGNRPQYGEILREGLEEAGESRKRSLAFRGAIYFPEGEDKLLSDQKQILQAVARQIGHSSELIEIRAEADDKTADVENPNRSAADPAYGRCIAARDYLVKLGIEPRRLRIAVVGAGQSSEERPRVQLYSVTEILAENPGKKPAKR